MKSTSNICESCGMPIHHLSDFGNNEDGTVNTDFCRHCYVNGKFVDHGITLEQKIENSISRAEKMGMPREEATILAHSTLPKLRRWKGLRPVE